MNKNKKDTKQELSIETAALAIGSNKIPTSRDLILQLYERVISEIMNAVSRSEDYLAIHSCIMNLHMPEDLNNPEKIKKVAQDILYMNNDACIRDRIKYLTGRLCAVTDMYSTLCACEVSQSKTKPEAFTK